MLTWLAICRWTFWILQILCLLYWLLTQPNIAHVNVWRHCLARLIRRWKPVDCNIFPSWRFKAVLSTISIVDCVVIATTHFRCLHGRNKALCERAVVVGNLIRKLLAFNFRRNILWRTHQKHFYERELKSVVSKFITIWVCVLNPPIHRKHTCISTCLQSCIMHKHEIYKQFIKICKHVYCMLVDRNVLFLTGFSI